MPNPNQRRFSAPKNTHALHHSFEETTFSRGDKRPRFGSVGADGRASRRQRGAVHQPPRSGRVAGATYPGDLRISGVRRRQRRSARPRRSYPSGRCRDSAGARLRSQRTTHNGATTPHSAITRPPTRPIGQSNHQDLPSNPSLNVREIVRVAENSHGGDLPKCPQEPDLSGFIAGAARGIRTPDPVITNDVLYQLSYCGGFRGS
jgi:hypothetical protein